MQTIDEDISTGVFHLVYLLYGEETYLKNLYKNRIQRAILPQEDPVNFTYFSGSGIDVQQIIDQAETMPFFADHRLILVEDSGLFKSGAEKLAAYLPQMPPETILVFAEDEVDKRSRLYKAVVKCGHAAEFKRQDEQTLRTWVVRRVKKAGLKIGPDAYALFREKTGNDMETMEQELDKLLAYAQEEKEITCEDVEDICTQTPEDKIFQMIRAIASHQQKEALDLYYDLLANKEAPMRILFLIARQFNQLLQVKDLNEQGTPVNDIAKRMGLYPGVARQLCAQASHFSKEELKQAVAECVEAEEQTKTGKLQDRLAVEMLIVSFSS